jgi:hypothetical protein
MAGATAAGGNIACLSEKSGPDSIVYRGRFFGNYLDLGGYLLVAA